MATVRRNLSCDECGATVATRSAIGHADYQEFAFPCPRCKMEIRFGMTLDQEAPSTEYTLAKNLTWLSDRTTEFELKFDSEHLIRKKQSGPLMPFMETSFYSVNIEKTFRQQAERYHSAIVYWPLIEKLLVHQQNRNVKLFKKNAQVLGYAKDPSSSERERLLILLKAMNANSDFWILDGGIAKKRIVDLYMTFSAKPEAQKILLNHYNSEKRGAGLWKQLLGLRKAWNIKIYFMVFPVYAGFDWDSSRANLDDFTLCQKRFDELKGFYVDCFETLCRFSVLAASFAGFNVTGKLEIPTSKGTMSISEFETMANGSKGALLSKLDIGDIFVPFIDSKLRNGFGHNANHYDVFRDVVHYENHSSSRGIEKFEISYLRFCEKIIRIYAQIESVSELLTMIRIELPNKDFTNS